MVSFCLTFLGLDLSTLCPAVVRSFWLLGTLLCEYAVIYMCVLLLSTWVVYCFGLFMIRELERYFAHVSWRISTHVSDGYIPRSGIAGSQSVNLFDFDSCCQAVFNVAVVLYPHGSSVLEFLLLHIVSNTWFSWSFMLLSWLVCKGISSWF